MGKDGSKWVCPSFRNGRDFGSQYILGSIKIANATASTSSFRQSNFPYCLIMARCFSSSWPIRSLSVRIMPPSTVENALPRPILNNPTSPSVPIGVPFLILPPLPGRRLHHRRCRAGVSGSLLVPHQPASRINGWESPQQTWIIQFPGKLFKIEVECAGRQIAQTDPQTCLYNRRRNRVACIGRDKNFISLRRYLMQCFEYQYKGSLPGGNRDTVSDLVKRLQFILESPDSSLSLEETGNP